MAHTGATAAGAYSGARAVPGKMAARADTHRPRAARRDHDRPGHGRCGIRRYSGLSNGIGAAPAGLCPRRVREIRGVGRATPADLEPSTRAVAAATSGAIQVADWAAQQPARAWRRVTWRNGPRRAWHA